MTTARTTIMTIVQYHRITFLHRILPSKEFHYGRKTRKFNVVKRSALSKDDNNELHFGNFTQFFDQHAFHVWLKKNSTNNVRSSRMRTMSNVRRVYERKFPKNISSGPFFPSMSMMNIYFLNFFFFCFSSCSKD